MVSAQSRNIPSSPLKVACTGTLAVLLAGELYLLTFSPAGTVAAPIRLGLSFAAVAVLVLGLAFGIRHAPSYALAAILAIPLGAVYIYTGLLLPWSQLSFALGQSLLEGILALPVVGMTLAQILFGGPTLSQTTLRLAFTYHYTVVGLALFTFLGLIGKEVGRHYVSTHANQTSGQ